MVAAAKGVLMVVEERAVVDMEVAMVAMEAGCLVDGQVEETRTAAVPRSSTPQTESYDLWQCLPRERSARQS